MLLLALSFSLFAHAAPGIAAVTSGLNDTDTLVFSLVHTRSANQATMPVPAPAICLIGSNDDDSSKLSDLFAPKTLSLAMNEAHPCDFMRSVATEVEEVKVYPATTMVAGFWNATSDALLPHQFTFDTSLKGSEINVHLKQLQQKCAVSPRGCDNLSLILVRNNGGLIYRLPLPQNFRVSPDAKSVTYHPRDRTFQIDNYSLKLVP